MDRRIGKLAELFKSELGWNKARSDLMALFIVALIKVRSVNLTKIAVAMSGMAKTGSKYKRLQRFFCRF